MKKLKLTDIAPYSGKRVHQFDGLRRYMSTGDLKGDNLSFENVTYETKPSRADIIVSEGDILFAKMTNTNKALQIDKEHDGIIVSTGFSVHRPLKNKLFGEYFVHFLKHNSFLRQKNKLCTGAIQSAISNTGIEKIFVPTPDYDDQLHIANILTKAENLISQRKESIHLLDEFLKSTFLAMFGNTRQYTKSDVVKTIGEICNSRGGGTPSKAKPEYYTGDIPWVSPKDMKWLYITTSQDKITQKAINESSTTLIPIGSLLMVIRSGILKSKLPLAINKVDVTINQDMKAFTSKEVTTEYLLYFFFCEERNILKKVKGTTADNLNFDDIKKMKIKVPPLSLQIQFAQIVEKTETLKTKYQQSLQELENLYGSLSQSAFKGELKI
jgi:type I restriction enzyme, S subunit